jgi:hypothetical protein
MIPRVARRVEENTFYAKAYDPSLRIANPGKLGATVGSGRPVDARLAEQCGWITPGQINANLLLAAHGGYAQVMRTHMDGVPKHENLMDNVAVIKSALDSYTRPSDFTWVVVTNGTVALVGEFDVPDAQALRVCVDCHKMLDPRDVNTDVELPALRVGGFVVEKSRPGDRTISFSEDVQLVGLTNEAPEAARMVAHDAALAFLRPSRNRSRVLSVSVQAIENPTDPSGPVISSRLFDIEYRWRNLEKEEARFDGSAVELNGSLSERVEAVADGVRQRQMVAAIVSDAARVAPHSIESLASRLRHYDARLGAHPELVNNERFLMVLSVVSGALMPLLKAQLAKAPAAQKDLDFVTNYNICARYLSEVGLVVA